MIPLSAILLLLITTAWGWLIGRLIKYWAFYPAKKTVIAGIRLWGAIPELREKVLQLAGTELKNKLLSPGFTEKIVTPGNVMADLKPEIENHVDHFIKVKLEEHFPLLAKFMGEKTLGKLKEAFLGEVEELLPVLLQKYSSGLFASEHSFARIEEQLAGLLNEKILNGLKNSRKWMQLQLATAIAGALLGLILLLVYNLLHL